MREIGQLLEFRTSTGFDTVFVIGKSEMGVELRDRNEVLTHVRKESRTRDLQFEKTIRYLVHNRVLAPAPHCTRRVCFLEAETGQWTGSLTSQAEYWSSISAWATHVGGRPILA